MKSLAAADPKPLAAQDAERIWMLAQIDAQFAARREAGGRLVWVDVALESAAGFALAAISVAWLAG